MRPGKDFTFYLLTALQSRFVRLQRAVEGGASVVRQPWEESDKDGTVRFTKIRTYGDLTHTLIDRSRYKGWFLPGFQQLTTKDPVLQLLYVFDILFVCFSLQFTTRESKHLITQFYATHQIRDN